MTKCNVIRRWGASGAEKWTYGAVGGQIQQQAVRRQSLEEHDDAGGHGAQRLLHHRETAAVEVERRVFSARTDGRETPKSVSDCLHLYLPLIKNTSED